MIRYIALLGIILLLQACKTRDPLSWAIGEEAYILASLKEQYAHSCKELGDEG